VLHNDDLKSRGARGVVKAMQARQLMEEAKCHEADNMIDIPLKIESRRLQAESQDDLSPREPVKVGVGGEALPQASETIEVRPVEVLRMTLMDGDQVNLDASWDRIALANGAGVLTLALDAAETIQARNSLEQALAHQLAAAHALSMKLLGKATENISGLRYDATDTQRVVNSAARLMAAYQQGILTIQRLRTGGKQEVRVTHVHQHVQVNGGQVAVAGNVGSKGTAGGQNEK